MQDWKIQDHNKYGLEKGTKILLLRERFLMPWIVNRAKHHILSNLIHSHFILFFLEWNIFEHLKKLCNPKTEVNLVESAHASIVSHTSPNAANRSHQAETASLHRASSLEAPYYLELFHSRPVQGWIVIK